MDRKLYDYILHGNLFDRFITEFSTGFLLRISPNYKKIRIFKPGQKSLYPAVFSKFIRQFPFSALSFRDAIYWMKTAICSK